MPVIVAWTFVSLPHCEIGPPRVFVTLTEMGNPSPPTQIEAAIADFVRRWHASAAAERANFQSFCNELCDLLAVPRPDPARQDERDNAYVYDKTVWFDDGDGKRTANFIDLYKRACFVMEDKHGSEADDGEPNLIELTAASQSWKVSESRR